MKCALTPRLSIPCSRFASAGLAAMVLLSGCSVGMAVSGKPDPNLGAVHVGATRGEVELQLGPPIETATTGDDQRTDIYEYETGNEPSPGRAIGHGVLDVLTFGLWEVAGTPIEGFQGQAHRITIIYDGTDHVIAVNSSAPTGGARPSN
jgi:hypothetical protein